jgi:ABC-type multidrug transport system fused ATPase/permease subunit
MDVKMENFLENIKSLPPDISIKILELSKSASETQRQELANAHENNKIILEQRGLQLNREYILKKWSLIISLIITMIAIIGGIYLVMMQHENAGMAAIVSGAGLSIADAIRKRAEKLFSSEEGVSLAETIAPKS